MFKGQFSRHSRVSLLELESPRRQQRLASTNRPEYDQLTVVSIRGQLPEQECLQNDSV